MTGSTVYWKRGIWRQGNSLWPLVTERYKLFTMSNVTCHSSACL